MKNILTLSVLILLFFDCKGQKEKTASAINIENLFSINFLHAKFQSTGFFIPDTSNPYPTYTYSDKKIGVFSVDFIGKTDETQYFWNPNNSKGYYSKSTKPENDSQNSKAIKNHIKENDYYIVASYLPSKFITYTGGEDGEFEPKQNAKTTFYLYEDRKWKQIGEIETSKIPEDILAFETSLIQKELFENLKNNSSIYDGIHSISVETEATTTGMASISYKFDIKKNNILLSLNTHKESNLCEGKYIGIEKDNHLEVYYSGDQLNCVSIDPKFIIKHDKNQFYIKGIGGESTNSEWIMMQ